MASYGQFCPVAKTCEFFAERWTPLVVRELCFGPARFNDLRRRLPLISKTLLTQRLRELEERGIVSITGKAVGPGHVYALTPAGEELRGVLDELSAWGLRHTQSIMTPEEIDPTFMLMSVRSQIPPSVCPSNRFVICFAFSGVPGVKVAVKRWWYVFRTAEIELCMKDPGFAPDVTIEADLELFTRAWLGQVGLRESAGRRIVFNGAPDAVERAKALMGLLDRPRQRRLIYGPPEMVDAERARAI